MIPFIHCATASIAGKRTRRDDLVAEAEALSVVFARHGSNDEIEEGMKLLNKASRTVTALAAAIEQSDVSAVRALVELQRNVASTTRASIEFLRDQASGNVIVFDLETTELIRPNVPKSEMSISVACAMVLYADTVRDSRSALDNSAALTFWHRDTDGAPISLLIELLRAARLIVVYNGVGFDLKVLQKYMDEAEMRQLQGKTLDPFAILRNETNRWFKLNALLLTNGLVPKSNSGAAAPALWREGRLQELEAYCARDVEALASLVLKPRIRLSSATSTDSVSLLTALGLAGDSGEPAPSNSPSDTRLLQQGSRAWHEARQGLITASLAPALLELSPFQRRNDTFERLLGDEGSAPTAQQRRGTAMEAGVVELYREERGLSADEVQTTGLWRHPEVQWLAASPDRIVGDSMLLEVKTSTQVGPPTPAFLVQITIQMACARMTYCDLVQFNYKTKALRIDRVRYDMDLFTQIYKLLAPVAAKAADARALGTAPEDAYIESIDFREHRELRDELRDTLKTHVRRLL